MLAEHESVTGQRARKMGCCGPGTAERVAGDGCTYDHVIVTRIGNDLRLRSRQLNTAHPEYMLLTISTDIEHAVLTRRRLALLCLFVQTAAFLR